MTLMSDDGAAQQPRVRLRRDGLIRQPFYHVHISDVDGRTEKIGVYNPMLSDDHPEMLIVRRDRLDELFGGGVVLPTDFAERARRWRNRRENDRSLIGIPCA